MPSRKQRGTRFKESKPPMISPKVQKSIKHTHVTARRNTKVGRILPVIIVIILLALGAFGIHNLVTTTSVFNNDKTSTAVGMQKFEVAEGSSWKLVAKNLEEKGLIDNSRDFLKEVEAQGAIKSLKPGVYHIDGAQSYENLVSMFVAGSSTNTVTIPEGRTVAQTAQLVEEATAGTVSASKFLEAAKASNYVDDYPFLEGAYNDSLEGYLFPKTYEITDDTTADSLIKTMLSQYTKETEGISYDVVEARGLSHHDLVTIASLIERESAAPDERPLIASVIYNRLDSNMKLQFCSSIVYALDGKTAEHLTQEDLQVDSPYNTYKNKGVPPGPICSPSLSSLIAAANPESSNYLYFVAAGDGTHNFTDDYSQFTNDKVEYWNLRDKKE